MIDIADLPLVYQSFRARYEDRDDRFVSIDAAVAGDWSVVDPDNEKMISRSPNLVQVALEDTAEAAGSLPTIRVTPYKNTAGAKKKAGSMECIAAGYCDFAQMELLIPQTVMDMAAFGLGVWVVWPDYDERLPFIEKRDPRYCYPEPGFRPGQETTRCIFARRVHYSQMPADYQAILEDFVKDASGSVTKERQEFTLVEYFDTKEIVTAALFAADTTSSSESTTTFIPIELDRQVNRLPVCPVVIGSRFTLDGEFRGQFDQIIGVLEAHVRLMSMLMDYADQAVYSDIWVKDLIGELSWGGGAYIELGPQGAIGRVPPAVSSLNVANDLDRLVDSIHLGGRWPKSRPGQVDQSIASAKFVEAVAGVMNTAIKTYHQLLGRMMEHALRVCFLTDQAYFPTVMGQKKSISGILRNQEFIEEYDPADIEMRNKVRVEYGLGLGRDPAQSAVLMLQYADKELISDEFVQENIDGLNDVNRERIRVDTSKFAKMALADLLNGISTGSIPKSALIEIWEAREKGEDLAVLYRKFVVEPSEAPAATGPQSLQDLLGGVGGPTAAGAPGGAPGGPPAPAPGQPLEGGPPPVPPPPDAGKMIARLSSPAGGPGNFIGSQLSG